MVTETNCPCGSENTYPQCCEPYLLGKEDPATAEALMRSRYVAYTRNNGEYILSTWHASTRPKENPVDESLQWCGLEILSTTRGGKDDEEGVVEFRAKCRVKNESAGLDESSEFVKEDGRWYYLDGGGIQPIRSRHDRVGRNEPCPCGSGKKFKKCCGP